MLADTPSSGTAEYHVLNPVTHGKIEKQQVWRDISVRWIAEEEEQPRLAHSIWKQ